MVGPAAKRAAVAHLQAVTSLSERRACSIIGADLRREGEPSGINRIYRLYREEGFTVRKRRARRKAVGTRAPILVEAKPNARCFLPA